jgi:uncharacterized protein (TIGR00369 family)
MHEEAAELDGLAQLQSMLMAGQRPPMNQRMNIDLVEVTRGTAIFEGEPDGSVFNPLGSVHGGYAATLLDSACGVAVHSQMRPGQGYTTLELKIAYHRGLSEKSGRVRAEGRIVSIGRRVAFAEATLHDSQNKLCATATSTLLIFDLPR